MTPSGDPMVDSLSEAKGEEQATDLDLRAYRQMVFIRKFEEAVQSLFLRGEVYGSTHLCIGQEAVSVGACNVVRDRDLVAATYRGHGHALALGVDPQALMDELLGRRTGICGGRSGSMNIVDLSRRLIGCFGIVGGSIAAATGAALSLKRSGGVAFAFFGDGAANQAYFHECLNFAKTHSLPVVYICENNQYGEFTPTERVTPGGILARPAAMQIPSRSIDGNDLWMVRSATQEALERVLAEGGPVFIEAVTYRFSDHGRGDPYAYRPPGEVDHWRARDPIMTARRKLVETGEMEQGHLAEIESEVETKIEEIKQLALQAPYPDPEIQGSEFKAG